MKNTHKDILRFFRNDLQLLDDNLNIIGNSVFIIPHQDDEALACGGIIYSLKKQGFLVYVIFVTDGSMSHPNSINFPKQKRLLIREEEAKKSLHSLGIPETDISFLRLPDSELNVMKPNLFFKTVMFLRSVFEERQPKTIFLPWRDDPHPDHKEVWRMVAEAIKKTLNNKSLILEYPVWFWERGTLPNYRCRKEIIVYRMNIERILMFKEKAIQEHASQLGKVIDDDLAGFCISEEMVRHFLENEEIFFCYKSL